MKFASPDVPGLLKKSMRLLQAGKTEAERAFIELVKKSHGRELQIIESIPGIGESTAARLITSVGDFRKFTSSQQVVSYLGLSPTRKWSGTSLNSRGPISRMGGCRMRSFLYLCGISAMKYNGDCKAMWKRMKAAGKPGKVIIVAIANKLVRQTFVRVRNDSTYIKNYANCL